MRRRLFTVFSALSLVLCVVVAGLWGSALYRGDADGFLWASRHPLGVDGEAVRLRLWNLSVDHNGFVEFARISLNTTPATADGIPDGVSRSSRIFAWAMGSGVHNLPGGSFTARLPAWLVISVTAATPLAWYWVRLNRLARERRARRGLCPR